MIHTFRKTALTVGALGALGLGGSTIAGAAQNSTAKAGGAPQHQALSADVAAKVKAAALAKVPGATVVRTEAGGPNGSAYHAHIKTSDGKLQVVLVNASFQATDVVADRSGNGHRGRGHGGGAGETPLTGDTKTKVEAAVLAKYPGATIVRTETNADGSNAPYESHIKTSGGKELEVRVSKDFAVVDSVERAAHR